MQTPHILMIDSGVGGLSIARNVLDKLPSSTIHYIADNAFFPYGALSEVQLIERVCRLIDESMEHFTADFIVVACNTASTAVLSHLRKRYTTPIIGVVPAIKPAAAISESKSITVLATQGTIERNYTRELVENFAQGCSVTLVATPKLAELAEKKLANELPTPTQLHLAVPELTSPSTTTDTVVLACTHFPLLKTELQQAFPNIKHWVDSGEAIARRVHQLLETSELPKRNNNYSHNIFRATSPVKRYSQEMISRYLSTFDYHS